MYYDAVNAMNDCSESVQWMIAMYHDAVNEMNDCSECNEIAAGSSVLLHSQLWIKGQVYQSCGVQ